MENVKTICVFCGSRSGTDPAHAEAAARLGQLLAERGIRLIYGGGGIGLMGIVAKAALDHGGEVVGIIPDFLFNMEVGTLPLTEQLVVGSMHERKAKMFALSDAFVALPGGIGTLEETLEITTWKQLRQHDKPIVLLNTGGYWDPLTALMTQVIDGGFAHHKVRDLWVTADTADGVFDAISAAPQPDAVILTSHLERI
ncbi:TIGR00730 family Rossman fold protein [Magnetospira thiophila]